MSTENHHASSLDLPSLELSNAYPTLKSQYFFRTIFCILLALAYPIARLVPHSWAWENGTFEWAQAFILFFALAPGFGSTKLRFGSFYSVVKPVGAQPSSRITLLTPMVRN